MKFHSSKLDGVQQTASVLNWAIQPYINSSQQSFGADTWVQLLELPSSYSSEEALLLCHEFGDLWLAWIPGHGETVLHSSQFCHA